MRGVILRDHPLVTSPSVKLRRSRSAAPAHDRANKRRSLRRTWTQRLVITGNIFLVMLSLTSAWALAFYNRQLSDIPRVGLQGALTAQTSTSDPMNILLVGADSAEGLDPNDPVNIGRNISELTDTVMILRVDPNQQKAWLLSLPRDLYVDIAGKRGKDRINTALANGGPELLIQTINEDFGIPIHHFMQVNFAAFKSLVDAVDGVNVYFNYPARDANTGLSIDTPGCHQLDGTAALAFARSRHYTALIDGRWTEDPTNDHGRIARQQYFIKQALKKAIEKGARNPIQLSNLLGVAQKYITIDRFLTVEQILELGSRFNNFNPDDLLVYEPYTRDGYAGEAAVLFLDEQPSQEMFNIFRGVNPLLNVLAATRVEVRNGTGKVGEAQAVADDLQRRGFTVTGVTDDRNFRNDRTIVKYAPGSGNFIAAVLVARYLDANVIFEEEPAMAATDHYVALVVGRDFTPVRTEPRPIEDFKDVLANSGQQATSTVVTTEPPKPGQPVTTLPADVPPAQNARSIVPDPPDGVEC